MTLRIGRISCHGVQIMSINFSKIRVFLAFLICILVAGCVHTIPVSIDSISTSGAASKKEYILLSGLQSNDSGKLEYEKYNAYVEQALRTNGSSASNNDLQYQEYVSYIERALALRGYVKAHKFDDAELAIFLTYGVDDPETSQHFYTSPIYGETGIASTETRKTVRSKGNRKTTTKTTTYTPTRGIVGYQTNTRLEVTYFSYILLDAMDLVEYRNTGKESQVWKTSIQSTGNSGDLRRIFPILTAAAKDYLGTSTGGEIYFRFPEDDESIIEITGSAAPHQ